MFFHSKELQFNARVTAPDPTFARLLLEQFGGGNGELKAAMQYFVQAFTCRKPYPDKYDLLMDIALEEFSHLEIVGATITMLLDGINGELKDIAGQNEVTGIVGNSTKKEEYIHQALMNPQFLVLSGGGPTVTDSNGNPWSGHFVNANGDLTVDFRSNMGAESRAKIVYEYLMQFTDDSMVKETLSFLMTREIAHFKMFDAALQTIQPNFPPGILQGDPRFTHTYFNTSNGVSARGPWNQGQGTNEPGEKWIYIEDPAVHVVETAGLTTEKIAGSKRKQAEIEEMEMQLSEQRTAEIAAVTMDGEGAQWSSYPQSTLESPPAIESAKKARRAQKD